MNDRSTDHFAVLTMDEPDLQSGIGGRRRILRDERRRSRRFKAAAAVTATTLCASALVGVTSILTSGRGDGDVSIATEAAARQNGRYDALRNPRSGIPTTAPRDGRGRAAPSAGAKMTSSAPGSSVKPRAKRSGKASGAPSANNGTSGPSTTTDIARTPTNGSSSQAPKPPPAGFPNASNTGVPAGTTLSKYSGPCTLRTDALIDSKSVNCDVLAVYGGTLTITRSKINNRIDVDNGGKLVLSDSEVDADDVDAAAVGYANLTISRSHIHHAKDGVACYQNCTIRDSYIHVDTIPSTSGRHMQAFLSNGGSNIELSGNTLSCTAPTNAVDGGCTADVSIFGDFAGNHNYLIDGNLFVSSDRVSYCTYGGYDTVKPHGRDVSNIVFKNNVYQRGAERICGAYGPATSFNPSSPGNAWLNNRYDDGTTISTPPL